MRVTLFIPCFIDSFYPQVGMSIVRILERLGHTIDFPEGQTCCGQPPFNSGFWDEARDVARRQMTCFRDAEVIVSASGSCGTMMKVFYPEIFKGLAEESEAKSLSGKVWEFSEFLVSNLGVTDVGARFEGKVTFHTARSTAFPQGEPGKTTPLRVRMEQHVARPQCVTCHVIIDPPGYALENFNAIGQWQDTEASVAIDASGQFPDDTRFDGPAQFRIALLDRRDAILNNISEVLLTYALGRLAPNSTAPKMRALEYYEMPAVRGIVREAAPSNYRWSALITAVVKSAPFQTRMLEDK